MFADRTLIWAGSLSLLALALALWVEAGSGVFSTMMTGLVALCF
ncbi:hypothetical protein MCEMSEM23_00254 [Rhabdaerophilaceae bacterium]